jgi:hypothetical protein
MGIVNQSIDVYYTYRFLRLLTTEWKDTDAFKLGIIDEKGKPLKKPSQLMKSEEKDAYTVFHRLVFNIRRIIESLPFGKTKIATFAAALYLLKEQTKMTDEDMMNVLTKAGLDMDDLIHESVCWFVLGDNSLAPGSYDLLTDVAAASTGEMIARKGTRVAVDEGTKPVGFVFNEPIYRIRHAHTRQDIYVSAQDLTR